MDKHPARILGDEYYWECISEDQYHYARYSLFGGSDRLYSTYVIDKQIDVYANVGQYLETFKDVSAAMQWCETMILTGAV